MLFGELALPYFGSLGVVELAVIDSEAVAKDCLQPVGQLTRQHDFWQQVQHLFPTFDSLCDKMDVDLSLAAGGDAMKKADSVVLPLLFHGLQGGGLGRGEGGKIIR